jgi:hypothetical protein
MDTKSFEMTETQRNTLDTTRRWLGELVEYGIFPVDERYRKHQDEFLALRNPRHDGLYYMVLVRPQKNGSILVRPYWHPSSIGKAPFNIVVGLKKRRVFWRNQNLRRPRGGNDYWWEYLTPADRRPYQEAREAALEIADLILPHL